MILCYVGILPWESFGILLLNGFLFKIIIAALDTPFFYLATWWFHKKFGIRNFEEIDFIEDVENTRLSVSNQSLSAKERS